MKFSKFPGDKPPDPLALVCYACWLRFAQHKDFLNQTLVDYVTS